MIYAETIRVALELHTDKFNRSITEALALLRQMSASGELGATSFGRFSTAIGISAGALSGSLAQSVRQSTNSFRSLLGSYAASMSEASVRVNEKVTQTKNAMLSIGSCAAEANQKSRQVASAIKAPFSELCTSAYSIMASVGDGLNKGLNARRGLILSTARSIANSVISTMRSVLKIASPSKVMKQIGEQTAQGMAIGINARVPDVGRSAEAMAEAVAGRGYAPVSGQTADVSSLASQLERLIALLSGGEQVMQVDGRAFARLIREYS